MVGKASGMVHRDSLEQAVQLMPEDVEGTMLFLNGNLIQSVLWEPLKQVANKMGLSNDVPKQIHKRVNSCLNPLIELKSVALILGEIS